MKSNSSCFRTRLEDIHWDFTNVENSGIHLLHWYPATFVSAIPGSLIPTVTDVGDTVLDPFCGSGSTGVESLRLGRRFIGFDLNPVAVMITESKLALLRGEPLRRIRHIVEGIEKDLFHKGYGQAWKVHPNADELAKWYHKDTLQQLFAIQSAIQTIRTRRVRVVATALFSSILKSVSSQGKHWGWVCDNVTPKVNELQHKDAISAYLEALDNYRNGVDHILRDMKARGVIRDQRPSQQWQVSCGDALELMKQLTPGSIDSIITSPPYYGVADYVKSQRLTFLWQNGHLSDSDSSMVDFEHLRHREVGSRSHRHRTTSHSDYMEYMKAFFRAARNVLKTGRSLCLVVGESAARTETVAELRAAASECGFQEEFASERDIKETRRRIRASLAHEYVLVYGAK